MTGALRKKPQYASPPTRLQDDSRCGADAKLWLDDAYSVSFTAMTLLASLAKRTPLE